MIRVRLVVRWVTTCEALVLIVAEGESHVMGTQVFLTFAKNTVGDHHHQELIFPRFLTGIKVPYRVVRPVSLSSLPQRFESFGALVRYLIPKRATPSSKAPGFELTLKPEDAWEPGLTWHTCSPIKFKTLGWVLCGAVP